MADAGYGSILELLSAPVDQQATLRALYLYNASIEVRRSIFDDSIDDNRHDAEQRANYRKQGKLWVPG